MRRLAALAAALLVSTTAHAVEVKFEVNRFANQFWIVDQLSQWSEQRTAPIYREALKRRILLTDARAKLFARYLQLRRTRSAEMNAVEDSAYPLGDELVSPPLLPPERFALSFLSSADVDAAAAAAGIKDADATLLRALFKDLTPDITSLLNEATFLEDARERLQVAAARVNLPAFLDRVARFYGVDPAAQLPFVVQLLWAPDGHANATVYANHIVLPISAAIVKDPEELMSWLGVLVHEVGHHFASLQPVHERRRITNLLFERYGLVNERHQNIFDEATQTAIGNILFVREHFPSSLDTLWFYNWEPHNARPDAIDSLGRALEPIVAKHLNSPNSFGGAFLDEALEAYRRVFGNAPRHHGHVGLVLAGKGLRPYARGLYWSRSRSVVGLDALDDFAQRSKENKTVTRWILLLAHEASAPVLERIAPASGTNLTLPAREAACAWAKRRAPGRGYDFTLIGKDRDAMRRLMIALYEDDEVSERAPRCIH